MSNQVNKECMEKILCHLTKLIIMTEMGETKELQKYINMSTSISAQLLAIDELDNNIIEIQDMQNEEKGE